jgi:uncharacterized damage-inducible protein DinB
VTSLFDDAIGHHIWATDRLLEVCEGLTDEQLATPVPGTYGPIIDTLRHLVATDGWYITFFRDRPLPIEQDQAVSIAELRAVNAANGEVWREIIASEADGERDTVEEGDGWRFHAPVGFRLAQTVQHSTDHRSQVCTGLTALGVEPPEIDVWVYGEALGRTRVERTG